MKFMAHIFAIMLVFGFTYLFLPKMTMAQGPMLYGMTEWGGSNGIGLIFHYDRSSGTQIVDYPFNIENSITTPYADLTDGGNGKFYGMAPYGGSNGNGIIFEWDPSTNTFTIKIELNDAIGKNPYGSLTLNGGKLYGMTRYGGANNGGVIFELNLATNIYTKKIDLDSTNGRYPFSSSLTLNEGKFYGMTWEGGAYNGGVIFEWNPTTNIYTKKINLYSNIGINPSGSLTLYGGKFYGMTSKGGTTNQGTIFEWNPATNAYTKKNNLSTSIGCNPYGSLTLNGSKFYGMTKNGGTNGLGVIFEWNPSTNVYTKKIDLSNAIGRFPEGSLTLNEGKFYGMTYQGGANGIGAIFEWNPSTNVYTKKIDLSFAIGDDPHGSLTLRGGKFYGMTSGGGNNSYGVIFEWDPATNIYLKKINFGQTNGTHPQGSLSLNGGKFYGMTNQGGLNGVGVIFEWDPNTGVYTKKIDLSTENGCRPSGSLTFYEGKFYGMTPQGGSSNAGVIFEWNPNTNIYTKKFDLGSNFGKNPYGSLTLAGGKFYGMTYTGGANNGVIFEWDPVTNIYTKKFEMNATTGYSPYGSLVLMGGKFYGMTSNGGGNNAGVIFEWDPVTNNYLKKIDLHDTVGKSPYGSLTLCGEKFYGMTYQGGANGSGAIFEWDPATNSVIKKIDLGTYSYPYGSLTLSGGKFYGMTQMSGVNYGGSIFEWDPATNIYSQKIELFGVSGNKPKYTQLVALEYFPPTLTTSANNVTCNGGADGAINISVFSGTPPFTYIWNNSAIAQNISNLTAGTYSVTVTDSHSCSAIASATVTQPPEWMLGVSISASANPLTAGTLATFTAIPVNGGATPFYHWFVNGFNVGTDTSIYTYGPVNYDVVKCMLTSDENCASNNPALSNTIAMTVTGVAETINITGSVGNLQTNCYNAAETIIVAGNEKTFLVQNGGNTTMVAGQNIIYLPGTTVQDGGFMHGYISDIYCGSNTASFVAMGTDDGELSFISQKSSFRLYPNPTSGKFTIELKNEIQYCKVQVSVFGIHGEKLLTKALSGEKKYEFTLSDYPYGLCFVKVVAGKYSETFKLVFAK